MSLHRTEIIGRLTADPETRMVNGATPVTNFNVAVDSDYKSRNGEDIPATFYRVAVWNKQADACAKYLHKGDPVYCDGEPSVRSYQGHDGTTKFSLELRANKVQFLSTKRDSMNNNNTTSQLAQYTPPASASVSQFEEDDLPF